MAGPDSSRRRTRMPRRRTTERTGTRRTPRRTQRWRYGSPASAAARESRAPHHIAELLAGDGESEPDDRRGQDEQQKAERRSLLPVEAGDELRVDLLGEPQRILAA